MHVEAATDSATHIGSLRGALSLALRGKDLRQAPRTNVAFFSQSDQPTRRHGKAGAGSRNDVRPYPVLPRSWPATIVLWSSFYPSA